MLTFKDFLIDAHHDPKIYAKTHKEWHDIAIAQGYTVVKDASGVDHAWEDQMMRGMWIPSKSSGWVWPATIKE